MAPRGRALAGTRGGYERCARCLHARLRHAEAGTGPCAQATHTTDTTMPGATVVRFVRCVCPRFQTPEELF